VLYWAKGQTEDFVKLRETPNPKFVFNPDLTTRLFRFKVQVRTPCGLGEISDELVVPFALPPDRMQPPSVVVDKDCRVNFSWLAGDERGAPITNFEVVIQRGSEYSVVCTRQFDDNNMFCTIPMSETRLTKGKPIIAMVRA